MKARSLLMTFIMLTHFSVNALIKEGISFVVFNVASSYISSLVNDRGPVQEPIDKHPFITLQDSPDHAARIRISSELLETIIKKK